ncbi:hypothetical protein AFCA_010038 [Aspergillus flavus]|nr:hypothetical protein AFCA_010038 [Aspergillus flavus]
MHSASVSLVHSLGSLSVYVLLSYFMLYFYIVYHPLGDLIERPSGADPDDAQTYDTDCFNIIFDQADIEVHALLHVADEFIQHSAVGSEV